jgi:hypothetical protein
MTECASLSRGRMMRLTRLDECGVPVEGTCSTLVTDGVIQVASSYVYQDPEEIQQANANGALCVDDQSDPALRWVDLNIQLCRVDPDAVNIITNDPLVVDDAATPETVGWRVDSALTGTANFALEMWSGVPNQICPASGFPLYGYWLWPWVRQATWGEKSVTNGALNLDFTARTQAGGTWGVGPYNVVRDVLTPFAPGPLLTAIGATTHEHFQFTNMAPPESACGCTSLVIP